MTVRRARLCIPAVILLGAALLSLPGTSAAAERAARPGDTVDARAKLLPPGAKDQRLALKRARQAVRSANDVARRGPAVGGRRPEVLARPRRRQRPVVRQALHAARDREQHRGLGGERHRRTSTATEFPAGDCRNGRSDGDHRCAGHYLIDQFDNTIYPIESDTFSVPPSRDGTGAELAEILELPADYYQGDGDDIAVLVDNVRDENFYDTNNANTLSYIAGFFSSQFNELLNRNVMTIDAWDWLHRTGANPPHEPSADPCTSAPARPSLYEGVFAHEYQHLLEYYEDPGESIWVNEGLADWAQTLTGYVDPSIPITDLGYDSHVQCFLGYLGVETEFNPIPRQGGPEQSLNLWGDQTDFESEIFCDYGAAYTMMELLADRFGPEFMGDLHRDDLHGFESLESLLAAAGGPDVSTLIDTWAAMTALDGVLDDGADLRGGDAGDFQVSTLDASVNWGNDQTYSSPGAPPNGSDFVRARNGSGTTLGAKRIRGVSFSGAAELPSLPIEWTVDADPADQPGDPALFAGTGDNLDRSIVREVAVPTGTPQLTFDADWSLEDGFDYAYVQVSTDGGESYETIPCSDQVDGPLGSAFNGESGGFLPESCDLSAFAGQTVVISFRLVTDSSVNFDGFWVDDVAIGDTVLSDGSTLDGWSSRTEFNPIDVEGYTVRIVAYDSQGHDVPTGKGHPHVGDAWTVTVPLNAQFAGHLRGKALRHAIGTKADIVSVIVTYHDSTEQVQQYAPYRLWVNGWLQPGG